mmetsp:Transcript_2600/g.4915  ORF Transcript_2600/g.4915 Transcript_2600/m.4915 type:complete len:427 (+) Transcript_2600:29-1309(+)|eukprot:CAMPEP_0175087990 /NCGR_PEP_ID=MMETSP0086_2-20121207/13_1 /TAXON_ID=136419 /ORGANISM="Unknown Unknown, Strain D1" /LENGTH=426 /DNA_ID=CAMNT_0016360401 /DNA_START=25 /DNA_END=1305 /DNA_ORIENTATION=+
MVKRTADNQLTKDDVEAGRDDEVGEVVTGTWHKADEDKLKGRTFVKAKRSRPTPTPTQEGAASSFPNFSFGVAAGETKEEQKAPATNAFTALLDPTEWVCSECYVRNKKELTKCRSCQADRPAAEADKPAAAADKPAAADADKPVNAFAALLDPTEWVCAECMVRNKKDAIKCKACEANKPGAKEDNSGPTFSFGTTGGSTPTFSFGSSGTSTSTPSFSFGSSTTWSFGSAAPAASGSAPSFTFGASIDGAKATFGSVQGEGFKASSDGLGAATATLGSNTADATKPEFKDKKRESTGEEGDTRVFSMPQTKVFVLTEIPKEDQEEGKKTQKYVEKGQGELHLNTLVLEGKKKARLVLRADKTQRLVLNAPLYSDTKPETQAEKFVRFVSIDADGKPCSYLLRFKNKSDRGLLFSKMEETIKVIEA